MNFIKEEDVRKIVTEVVERLMMASAPRVAPAPPANVNAGTTVALGADHGGFELKERLKGFLNARGLRVVDCGTFSKESADYPDFAAAVARRVVSGEASRGIMLDGAGIGSAMVANKIKGARAALCYNEKTIINSRAHNNANILTLGANFHEPAEAEELVTLWLKTEFEAGRYERRVQKIDELDHNRDDDRRSGRS